MKSARQRIRELFRPGQNGNGRPVDSREPSAGAETRLHSHGEYEVAVAGEGDRGWVLFDEQRLDSEFHRADIVFGPDIFDPRTENGERPITEAMRAGRAGVNPDDLGKTLAEAYPGMSIDEIRHEMLETARSVELGEAPR